MPRPKKWRKVCCLPKSSEFHPINCNVDRSEIIILSVDEYETIRLIDYENLTQAECAKYMNVARTTIQEIYSIARKKLSIALVEAMPLRIEGGEYKLCDGEETLCYGRKCRNHRRVQELIESKGELKIMKIAVTYENGEIFQHFGHTESFKFYEIENNEVAKSEVISTNGSGHGALAQLLKEYQVDTLICGGIGGGAQTALREAQIKLYGGVTGNADDAVNALLENKLDYNKAVKCNHHDHEHGNGAHTCGEHGCGNH